MIERNLYLNHLEEFIDKPFIKIITGIRRCGKSTVMLMLRDKLMAKGIKPEQITYINFESFNYSDIQTAKKLYEYISSGIQHGKKNYLLLDEIQEVEQWEKCINSLLVDFDSDIYLTGSNSHILSSEMATYLAGRYIEIPVFTLSFKEYLYFISANKPFPGEDKHGLFYRYLRQGGFPVIHTNNFSEDTIYKIVFDIYSSIILRDTIQRYKIRDVELLVPLRYFGGAGRVKIIFFTALVRGELTLPLR